MLEPSVGQIHQRVTYFGSVQARKTSSGGASKTRVRRISRSEGKATSILRSFGAATLLLLLLIGLLVSVVLSFALHLIEDVVEAPEALFPELAVAAEPRVRLAERVAHEA